MKKHAVLNLITAAANVVYIAYLVVIFAGTWSHGAASDALTLPTPGYSSIIRLYLYLWPMLIVDTAVLVKNFLRLTRREVCTKEAGLFITNIALFFNAYGTGFSYMLSENAAVIVFAFTALSVVIDAAALFINVNILKNVRSMDVYDDTYAYGK